MKRPVTRKMMPSELKMTMAMFELKVYPPLVFRIHEVDAAVTAIIR